MSVSSQAPFRASLEEWWEKLKVISEAAYVGPRPQTPADKDMLVGRNDLLEEIRRKVQDSALLILDGESGSGKTSLLQNGLMERLQNAGFVVLVCRRWDAATGIGEGLDLDAYLSSMIRATYGDPDSGLASPPIDLGSLPVQEAGPGVFSSGLCAMLDEVSAGSGVLVLDQFEQLLRYHPLLGEALVSWIKDVVTDYETRVVISLRTDSTHLLDAHLKPSSLFSLDRLTVPQIDDLEDIEEIVRNVRSTSTLPTVAVTDTLVESIRSIWSAHRQPRLLGLQALLQCLYYRTRTRSGWDRKELSPDVMMTIDDTVLEGMGGEEPGAELESGMLEFVTTALLQAGDASERCGLDRYLLSGTAELVRRSVPYLWSGGFKVEALERELAANILAPELRILAPGRELAVGEAAGALVSAMLESGDLFNFQPEVAGLAALTADSRDVATAGPLMGRPAADAVVEEARRAAFGVQWLVATGILKRSGDGILTLVHDGSGGALREWADGNEPGIYHAAYRLTAARGEQFDFRSRSEGASTAWNPNGQVLVNANWRDCRVTADLTDVTFLNCDFSGVRFVDCRLEGVTFVNCLLDDANFEECTIVGDTSLEPQPRIGHKRGVTRIAPSFVVPVAPELVTAFSCYVEDSPSAGDAVFFSDLAGSRSPATPGACPVDHDGEEVKFTAAKGGLALVGGRVCFLTFYRCKSLTGHGERSDGGSVAFHHASGGGLDIVEPEGGSIEMHDCAIRGVSFTRDDWSVSRQESSGAGSVEFRANESFLVNLLFSGGLRGTAEFKASIVWVLVNASVGQAAQSLNVMLRDCRYQFVVGASEIADSSGEDSAKDDAYFEQSGPGVSVFDATDSRRLARELALMDYRYEPERWERSQRRLWTTPDTDAEAPTPPTVAEG